MSKAFTLIEGLVAIGIIGILLSLIFVSFGTSISSCEEFNYNDCRFICGSPNERYIERCLSRCEIRQNACENI